MTLPTSAPPKKPAGSSAPDYSPSALEKLKAENPGAWMEGILDRDQLEGLGWPPEKTIEKPTSAPIRSICSPYVTLRS
jgi:hypothetical protein